VPPWNSFVLEDDSYIVILITTLTVSLVITTLMIKIRSQASHALEREERSRNLYQLTRSMSSESSPLGAAQSAARMLAEIFEADCAIYLAEEQEFTMVFAGTPRDSHSMSSEAEIAREILRNGEKSRELIRAGQRIRLRLGVPLICGGSTVAIL